jgi:hypothetical protein
MVEQGATRSDPADVVAPMGAYLNCVDEWSEGVVRSAQRPFRTRRHRCPLRQTQQRLLASQDNRVGLI